jgi:carbon starvation protein CstA
MITFTISVFILILGYLIYGKIVEKIFGADRNRTTPAFSLRDNVDYLPMSTSKAYLIEFLDIAGLGPVFGAILGAAYGPVAFIWIVIGGIFGGAVHDYMSGMMSVRQNGESIAEVVGKWMGMTAKQFMRVFTVFLMLLVGAAFMLGPAKILANMSGSINIGSIHIAKQNVIWIWVAIIFTYYFLATLLPIDKIIGRLYPIFGLALLFMAVGIGAMLYVHGSSVPELTFSNLHNMKTDAQNYPLFPLIFVTISCGAISGFHSTQSPLMARTIKNEKVGRHVFYGAMITESLVALIWAAAAMAFFNGVGGLNNFLAHQGGNPALFVTDVSEKWLGSFGGILAILGVVAAPITTGDTAFRSARLIISDFTKLKQNSLRNRLYIAVPLFAAAVALMFIKFDALWRLMFWFNQLLATMVLWAITVYLAKKHSKFYWISLIPAIFMTAVVSTYLFIAKEALGMPHKISYILGLGITLGITIWYFVVHFSKFKKMEPAID